MTDEGTNEPTEPAASDTAEAEDVQVERGELVTGSDSESEISETVTEPAKVMRIGSMVKQLLEEVRLAPLDEASRERLAEVYERSVVELSRGPVTRSARGVADAHAAVQRPRQWPTQ